MVCSCPPKGPELNLLVMASISWLDKIPLLLSPFSLPFLSIPASLKSCHLISLLNVHAPSHYLLCFVFFVFVPGFAHVDDSKEEDKDLFFKSCLFQVSCKVKLDFTEGCSGSPVLIDVVASGFCEMSSTFFVVCRRLQEKVKKKKSLRSCIACHHLGEVS